MRCETESRIHCETGCHYERLGVAMATPNGQLATPVAHQIFVGIPQMLRQYLQAGATTGHYCSH